MYLYMYMMCVPASSCASMMRRHSPSPRFLSGTCLGEYCVHNYLLCL